MAFSNSGGGILTLPSPSTAHQADGGSVRSLRRSLSRSPSRFHLLRADSHTSRHSDASSTTSSSSRSFQSLSPDSPCPQPHHTPAAASGVLGSLSASSSFASSTGIFGEPSGATSTPLPVAPPPQTAAASLFTTPLRSGVKLSLRSARPKTTSSKPVPRQRPSPRSPLKRALSVNTDMGNAAASSPPSSITGPSTAVSEPLLGQENSHANADSSNSTSKFSSLLLAFGSFSRSTHNKPSRHSMHLDLSGDSRLDGATSGLSSPLKRSDAIMNIDQTSLGSPVAKRRSLHGISSVGGGGGDFNVSDFTSPKKTVPTPRTSFDIHDDAAREYQLTSSASAASATSTPTTPIDATHSALSSTLTPTSLPKRTSSLRKSTLQQRHDPRSSWGRRQGEKYLQQHQQQLQLQQEQQSPPSQQQPKRSPNEWSFTAPHLRNRPRASLDQLLKPEPRESPFKARGPLPNPSAHAVDRTIGAAVPAAPAAPAAPVAPTAMAMATTSGTAPHQPHPLSRTLTTSSSSSSLPDDSPTHFPVQLPPDRPRHASIFARSLPLNAHRPRPEPVATPQYKSARPLQSVFASAGLVSKMNRNAEDEPLPHFGGRPMVMPDTPCKKQVYPSNTYPPSSGSGRKHQQRRFVFPAAPETPFAHTAPAHPRGTSTNNAGESVVNFFKLRSSHTRKNSILSIDGDAGDSQGAADGFDLPPTPTKSVLAKNLFGATSRSQTSPTAIRNPKASTASFTPNPTARRASVSEASPAGSSVAERLTPKTPRENNVLHNMDFAGNMAPPDASRLFISNRPQSSSTANLNAVPAKPGSSIFPPATPTTDRESYISLVDRRVSITPVHGAAPSDADAVLSARFGKIECVGKGEFSQVFRVRTRNASGSNLGPLGFFNSTPSKRAFDRQDNTSPIPAQQVFAVKKVRMPLFGQKEREAKLREVAVLEAVRNCENVLQIFDHWEQSGNLYIQTEFCDEGGLDGFLKKVGEHGRLDDFRIWKILLEVSQPANIFVTYEGHLKIGDFGMATHWPAPKGIEGEGDREYIGPEILQGKYDKPADVFSLGLIVLEIACNVFLPDNGPIWVALREGDMSVVPSLTAGEANALLRDAAGMPLLNDADNASQDGFPMPARLDLTSTPGPSSSPSFASQQPAGGVFGHSAKKPMGLEHPPAFMMDQHHAGSLDSVVSWLINPDPARRPTVHEILEIDSLQWIHARRRAPATVFEGNWGPEVGDNEDVTTTSGECDTEMTDV
ncbi:serine/threonine-protein kinase-like protein [Niveomyces insectorum RCEF 264]|uniref:Serine/threonine-protein kinase-like protein n=1 Tax=Niveomyces insectorum RCEF 264 TaxID=1081102 RepID=A0A167VEY1_9HYPO|nr:serine/threonine-protein kinase-like protein [Niveomyces insectorum RCEF 264]